MNIPDPSWLDIFESWCSLSSKHTSSIILSSKTFSRIYSVFHRRISRFFNFHETIIQRYIRSFLYLDTVFVLLVSLSPNVQNFFHGRNLERFITWPALIYNYEKGERGNSWARAIILVQCVQFRSQCLHIHGFNWVSLISGRLGSMLHKAIRYYGGVRNIWRAKAIEKDS